MTISQELATWLFPLSLTMWRLLAAPYHHFPTSSKLILEPREDI